MIPQEVIEEIKFRCDIVDVISGYVQLKRAGSNYAGLCPFHSERTPSFTVFPSTRNFYCFGCGAGGDVITFIMKRENVDYMTAVDMLAKRAGITLPEDDGRRSGETVRRERFLAMNREAARFYHACLCDRGVGGAGMDYLTGRGLSGATIRHFGLGFAPDGFSSLTPHLMKLGYTPEEMSAAFLCGISKKNGRPYDYFRNRVIFPIIDVAGNVVAFGGRVMDSSLPKYLNTSDTPVFKKSRNLFALNFARTVCSERLILCEGYMDVIALHAHGCENAVATLGTALTSEQARIMSRYTKQVILCYDSDDAGQRATARAMKIFAEVGLDVRVLRITGAKDPDEFLNKTGPDSRERFKLMLDRSRAQFEYKLESVLSKHDISVVDEKIKAAGELCGIISEISSQAERDVCIGVVSEKLAIPRDSLKNDVSRIIRSREKTRRNEEMEQIIRQTAGFGDHVNVDTVKNAGIVSVEENILGILMLYPEQIGNIKSGKLKLDAEDFFSEFNRKVFKEIIARSDDTRAFDFGSLGEVFDPDSMGRITRMTIRRRQLTDNGEDVLAGLIQRLREDAEKRRLEENGDTMAEIQRILAEKRAKK